VIDIDRIKKRALRIRPLLVPMFLYIVFLALSVYQAPKMEPSIWRYLVALLPLIPGLWLAFGVLRATRKIDEMERRILFEAVVFSFMFTLITLFSFGLLGLVGVPQPSSINIVFLMCMLLVIGKFWGNWRYR